MPVTINYASHLGGDPDNTAVSTQPSGNITVVKKQAGAAPVTQQEEQVILPAVVTAKPPAIITVGAGRTVNLGNYNSAKVEVQLSYPCDVDDIEAGWEFAYGWVDKKIQSVLKDSEGN